MRRSWAPAASHKSFGEYFRSWIHLLEVLSILIWIHFLKSMILIVPSRQPMAMCFSLCMAVTDHNQAEFWRSLVSESRGSLVFLESTSSMSIFSCFLSKAFQSHKEASSETVRYWSLLRVWSPQTSLVHLRFHAKWPLIRSWCWTVSDVNFSMLFTESEYIL